MAARCAGAGGRIKATFGIIIGFAEDDPEVRCYIATRLADGKSVRFRRMK